MSLYGFADDYLFYKWIEKIQSRNIKHAFKNDLEEIGWNTSKLERRSSNNESFLYKTAFYYKYWKFGWEASISFFKGLFQRSWLVFPLQYLPIPVVKCCEVSAFFDRYSPLLILSSLLYRTRKPKVPSKKLINRIT